MHCSSYSCRERYKHKTNFTHIFFLLPGHVLASCSVFTVTFFLFVMDINGNIGYYFGESVLESIHKYNCRQWHHIQEKTSKFKNSLHLIL